MATVAFLPSPEVVQPQPSSGVPDICRESTGQPAPEPIQAESRAGELREEYQSIHNQLETKALSAKKLIEEEVYPLLEKMQALLSKRGLNRHCREAGLPTWTQYYKSFEERFNLRCLRTFERWLAQRHGVAPAGQGGNNNNKADRKKRPFFTGASASDADGDYLGMLTDLMDHIDKMRADVPLPILKRVDEYRDILKTPQPVIRTKDFVRKPSPKASGAERQAEVGRRKLVAAAIKNHEGTLIQI